MPCPKTDTLPTPCLKTNAWTPLRHLTTPPLTLELCMRPKIDTVMEAGASWYAVLQDCFFHYGVPEDRQHALSPLRHLTLHDALKEHICHSPRPISCLRHAIRLTLHMELCVRA